MKKIVTVIVSIAMIFVMSTVMAFGESSSEKLQDINEQTESVQADLDKAEAELEKATEQLNEIKEKVSSKEAQIEETENKIEKTKKEMDEREEGLEKRLRTMYKKGTIGYLDVLLGSHSISEFLSNIEMIQRIYENDQNVFLLLEKQEAELEKIDKELQKDREELKSLQAKAEEKSRKAESKKQEISSKLEELKAEQEAIRAEIAARSSHGSGKISGGRFEWPYPGNYTVTSPFSNGRVHPIFGYVRAHDGVDIGVPSNSTVVAADSGTVTLAEWYGGYGNYICIDHGDGVSTCYGHNNEILVSVGQHVERGQQIALSGSTGWSTGPHGHFEVRINGNPVDPMQYF